MRGRTEALDFPPHLEFLAARPRWSMPPRTDLDAFIANDVKLGHADDSHANTRLGCETLATTNKIVIAGEGRASAPYMRKYGKHTIVNREALTEIAREVVRDIGYDQDGFSFHGADVEVLLHGQSPDIAMGVDAKKKGGNL